MLKGSTCPVLGGKSKLLPYTCQKGRRGGFLSLVLNSRFLTGKGRSRRCCHKLALPWVTDGGLAFSPPFVLLCIPQEHSGNSDYIQQGLMRKNWMMAEEGRSHTRKDARQKEACSPRCWQGWNVTRNWGRAWPFRLSWRVWIQSQRLGSLGMFLRQREALSTDGFRVQIQAG